MKIKELKGWKFSLYCMTAAFITYCSMYAFRKPFSAATYDGLEMWGLDYKIILITAQVIGYTLSKFIGIRVVSSMNHSKRIKSILSLIGFAWISLLLFPLAPYPFNFILLFFNGLPLGMIWGVVFSFLEGRKNTELLGAGMSSSFIVASGLVKSVGKKIIVDFGVSDFWMPFFTGLIFVPFLLLGIFMLSKIPPPTKEDEKLRTKRLPMNNSERKRFFLNFAPGIVLVVVTYIGLNIFRDLRDNFAVEIWSAIGFENNSGILFTSEVPVAISVLIICSLMILIKNNGIAFFSNLVIIFLGGAFLIGSTLLLNYNIIPGSAWMILTGFGMYLSYVSYHTMMFERWIAVFNYKSNIGYLMYIADAFGYLGSVSVIFFKNFFQPEIKWLSFVNTSAYLIGFITIIFTILSFLFFKYKLKKYLISQ